MKSVRAVIGLPVLLGTSMYGRVSNVLLDGELKRLTGLYVDCGFAGTRLLRADRIRLIGEVSVLAAGKGEKARPEVRRMRRALAPDGRLVGAVTGAMLSERTGGVEALEVSGGLIEDCLRGRQWIYRYVVHELSGDVMIVPEGGEAE